MTTLTGRPRLLEGFAGAGGFSEGARMLGLAPGLGYELHPDACATATAAGHPRQHADIRTLDPADHTDADGWMSGPPCPTFSDGGKRTGRDDYGIILTAISDLPVLAPEVRAFLNTVAGTVTDPRTALVLETLEVAVALPGLQWLIAEQVPAVDRIWSSMAADLVALHHWRHATVLTLRADDFGAANRRTRVFLIATRDDPLDLTGLPYRNRTDFCRFGAGFTRQPSRPHTSFPARSMAAALGWPPGVRVNTRGDRKTAGGNEFSADGPAPSLTGRARSWYRTDLGSENGKLTAAEAGILQGFPAAYPWQGSRTSQFQRVADSVPPLMAAAVIGAATATPWQAAVRDRLTDIYGHAPARAAAPAQLDLFSEAS